MLIEIFNNDSWFWDIELNLMDKFKKYLEIAKNKNIKLEILDSVIMWILN